MTNSQLALSPGTRLLNGAYFIEKVLGQGGFGITYLVYDTTLERYLALKEFFPKDYCDRDATTSHITLGTQSNKELIERLRAKFLKEARNIASLRHPNIIGIVNAFEENGTAYYAMDYIEGGSLSELVRNSGALSIRDALAYINPIGDALAYVHSRHINHLDVKPANIMFRAADRTPILIDFGLSKQYDQAGNQTSTSPTGISHGFAPMEQYRAGGVAEFSPQADIYSLAATFLFLITGTVPPDAMDIMDSGIHFPQGTPQNVMDAICKAMAPRAKDRHQSMTEFLDHLNGKSIPGGNFAAEQTQIFPGGSQQESTRMQNPNGGGYNGNVGYGNQGNYGGYGNNSGGQVEVPKQEKESHTMLYAFIGIAAAIVIGLLVWLGSNNENASELTPTSDSITIVEENTTPAEDTAQAELSVAEAPAAQPVASNDWNSLSNSNSLAQLPAHDLRGSYTEKKLGSGFSYPSNVVRLRAEGHIDFHPVSLTCYMTPTGEIYGRYDNEYNGIKLDVNGYVDNLNNLYIQLGHGSERSDWYLDGSGDDFHYEGSWGKRGLPSELTFRVTSMP